MPVVRQTSEDVITALAKSRNPVLAQQFGLGEDRKCGVFLLVRRIVALRDDRIAAGTVATEAVEGVPQKLRKNGNGYSWGSAAKLLGTDVGQVREWIVEGKLKIVDGFVTERAFQDFCKQCGSELNSALLGNEVRDWLVEGYSLPVDAEAGASSIPGNQKHALVTRRCPGCRRPMRGNIFFRHMKNCKERSDARKPNALAG